MKAKLGAKNSLITLPTTLVGAMVNGKPNYITIADIGITGAGALLFITMNKLHYTNVGIQEHKTFSVNIPTVDQVKQTDYCGLVSGRKIDKSTLFDNFFGELKTAPMIRECPINMECRLIQTIDLPESDPKFDIFVGKIAETYCDSELIENGNVDFSKIHPIIFLMYDKTYRKLGEPFAHAWRIGKTLKKQ